METRRDIGSPHDWQRLSGIELVQNRVALASALGSPDASPAYRDRRRGLPLTRDGSRLLRSVRWRSFAAARAVLQRPTGSKNRRREPALRLERDSWLLLFDRAVPALRIRASSASASTPGTGSRRPVPATPCRSSTGTATALIATHVHDNFRRDGRPPAALTTAASDWPKLHERAIAATSCEMAAQPRDAARPPTNLPEQAFYKKGSSCCREAGEYRAGRTGSCRMTDCRTQRALA